MLFGLAMAVGKNPHFFFHICFLSLVLVCIGQTNVNNCLLRFTCVSFNIAIFQAQWFRYSFDRILNRILVLFQYIVAAFFSHLSLIPFGWTVILLPANTQSTKKQQLTMRSHKLCDFNVRLSNSGNKVE